LREEIVNTFLKKGYSVSSISSFEAPEQEIIDSTPDLVVLDINLPGKSGFELCKYLKARAAFPILILTARDTLADELSALGIGADDFLTKPCPKERLLARAERLLLTYEKMRNVIQIGEISLDIDTHNVIYNNSHIVLPETEGKILQVLMERHPKLAIKQELFTLIWGTDQYIDENILQVNITRLRKNLNEIGLKNIVQTVRGQGYCLEVSKT